MEWISVEDRLPEYTTHAAGDEFVHVIGNTALGVAEVMYCNGVWTSSMGIEIPVYHWMHLPEPPKETDNG